MVAYRAYRTGSGGMMFLITASVKEAVDPFPLHTSRVSTLVSPSRMVFLTAVSRLSAYSPSPMSLNIRQEARR